MSLTIVFTPQLDTVTELSVRYLFSINSGILLKEIGNKQYVAPFN